MDRKLNELCNKFYSGEELVTEQNNIKDYTKIVYGEEELVEEGKSGHGDKKIVINALKEAEKAGLITYVETKGGWLVKSTMDDRQEAIHKGERAFHYLRRFLNKLEK